MQKQARFVAENETDGEKMSDSASNWSENHELAERSRFKDYNKKHPREFASCFQNLGLVINLLNRFGGVKGFQVGFFRSEGKNVYRIGQTGVKHAQETRLYVHVDETSRCVRVITIGDKSSQSEDIRRCHYVTKDLKGEG